MDNFYAQVVKINNYFYGMCLTNAKTQQFYVVIQMQYWVFKIILDLCWSSDNLKTCSASADKSICIWDMEELKRIKRIKGHSGIVNSINFARRG